MEKGDLPLLKDKEKIGKTAYEFGKRNGLSHQIEILRTSGKKKLKDVKMKSSIKRGYIIELFRHNGIFEKFKKECWPRGNTEAGKEAIQKYLKFKQEYEINSGKILLDTKLEGDIQIQ